MLGERKGRRHRRGRIRTRWRQRKAEIVTQKIKLVMERPDLETLSKKRDRNPDENKPCVMGKPRQRRGVGSRRKGRGER